MLSGSKDCVVLPEHMQALWKLATQRGSQKKSNSQPTTPVKDMFKEFPYGAHSKYHFLPIYLQLLIKTDIKMIPIFKVATGWPLRSFLVL